MSLAAETRAAVRDRPWLLRALRAGVINYTAAAESLAVDGDTDSIATALRRFEDDIDPAAAASRDVTVRMRSGVGLAGVDVADAESTPESAADVLLSVGDSAIVTTDGSLTAIVVEGAVDAAALSAVVGRLRAENVLVDAAGVSGDTLVVVVPRSDGANALRLVESALEMVPE
ncbi:DUF7523 family protein [Halobellus clavatus]|uniref:Uncharacterized protein n=1 Tax=Halobellus clavatus TaxID=660517 RepID=A0A1H3GVU6_9EURY|nr:hypothetical protein [Halobellus clavatus]SDY07453.1 hypothetical protein SAMN04487946_10614 [Halobellus clavatus]